MNATWPAIVTVAIALTPGMAQGQISRYQVGPGTVKGRDTVVRPGFYSENLHKWVIRTELDARATQDVYPRESDVCIQSCQRMETAILRLKQHLSNETLSEYKAAWQRLQISHRDWESSGE